MSRAQLSEATPRITDEAFSEGLPVTPEFLARWRETREQRELARSLVQMRLEAGLTQAELAERMGKDQAVVSRMESATGSMPKAQLVALYAKGCGFMTAYAFLKHPGSDGVTLHELHAIGQDQAETTLLGGVNDVDLNDAMSVFAGATDGEGV